MTAFVVAGGRSALIPDSIDAEGVRAALAESADAARRLLAEQEWFVIVDDAIVLRHGEAPVTIVDGTPVGDTLLEPHAADEPPAPETDPNEPVADGAAQTDPHDGEPSADDADPQDALVRSEPVPGDHDGATISLAELQARRAAERAARAGDHDGDTIPSAPAAPAGSPRIILSTGERVAIDRTIVIGRSPRAARVSLDDAPRLVTVSSPQLDISRSHLEVRREPGAVTAVDLRTTNGTMLRRADADPVKLRAGEPTVVVTGDVLDIGDDVTITFEDLEW